MHVLQWHSERQFPDLTGRLAQLRIEAGASLNHLDAVGQGLITYVPVHRSTLAGSQLRTGQHVSRSHDGQANADEVPPLSRALAQTGVEDALMRQRGVVLVQLGKGLRPDCLRLRIGSLERVKLKQPLG